MMTNSKLLTIAIFLGALSGCSYALEEVGLFKTGTPQLDLLDVGTFAESRITFDLVKSSSLKTCQTCHSAEMDTAEKVLVQRADILAEVQSEEMPPRSRGFQPLTACEKAILETWIEDQIQGRTEILRVKDLAACGGTDLESPKPTPVPTPVPSPEPQPKPQPEPEPQPEPIPEPLPPEDTDLGELELSFANLKRVILEPKCLQCHTAQTARRTILDDLSVIEAQGLLAATAADSLLYRVTVPGLSNRPMPPRRPGLSPLTAAEVDYLKRWIESPQRR